MTALSPLLASRGNLNAASERIAAPEVWQIRTSRSAQVT